MNAAELEAAERAAAVAELREACAHAQTSLRLDPGNTSLRDHYERLRRQYATAVRSAS